MAQSFSEDFLEHATRDALIAFGFPTKRVQIISDRLAGGYICTTLRLKVEYDVDDAKLPPTVVIKLEEVECSDHEIASELHLYEREWLFYDKISASVRDAGVLCPKYFGPVKRANGSVVGVVLEDLCIENHASQCPMVTRATLCPKLTSDEVVLTVRGVARMHAKFYGKTAPLGEFGVQPLSGPWFRPAWSNKVQSKWPHFRAKWHRTGAAASASPTNLTDDEVAVFESVVKLFPAIQARLSSEPATFLHGDVKPANMFLLEMSADAGQSFTTLPSATAGHVVTPAFIDWQYIGIGRGVCDLAFFLIEGFEPEVAAAHEAAAVVAYHAELEANGYSFPGGVDALRADWQFAVAYFPVYVCMWFGCVEDDKLVDKTFPARVIARTAAALMRHRTREAAEALPVE